MNLAKATGIETVKVDQDTQFVAVNVVGFSPTDPKPGASHDELYALFMSAYYQYAPLSADAVTGAASSQGFFAKGLANIAAVVSGSYPKELADQKDLNDSQRLLRVKHYADNKPGTDTAKAWRDVCSQGINVYKISVLGGDSASLMLPFELPSDTGQEGSIVVGYDHIPPQYRAHYDIAVKDCLGRLAIESKEGDQWMLNCSGSGDAMQYNVVNHVDVQHGLERGGGGGAADTRP